MQQKVLMEKYPVFHADIAKSETTLASADDVVDFLKARIDADPGIAYVATFDHYAHTQAIGGDINPDMKAARNVVFCFGKALPNPDVLSVRPRSIGVADMGDHFHVSFLEAPMKLANETMEGWVKSMRNT